jgi:hypothetical protein
MWGLAALPSPWSCHRPSLVVTTCGVELVGPVRTAGGIGGGVAACITAPLGNHAQ